MRRRVCAGAWCLQTAVWGGVGSAAPADLVLPWCTWAVLSEVPPPALGCPLLTEQSSSLAFLGPARPGRSLRKWENRNAGNFSDFSTVEKQDQYFMSQVKCVSFRILASSLTVIPGASTRHEPLPWSFPVAVEVRQMAAPASQLAQASA